MEETDGKLWKALLADFDPGEQENITKVVQKELREQRAEVLRKATGLTPRRRGRPGNRRRRH